MNKKELESAILKAVKTLDASLELSEAEITFVKPKKPEFGDLATNIALKLASFLQKSPQEIAALLEKEIPNAKAAAGYLNFRFSPVALTENLKMILKLGTEYGSQNLGKGQKVQVEFISANPTGPLTLANGRGGYSGDVLANLLKKAGWQVEREYYVNDRGNQVKLLGESILFAVGFIEDQKDLYRGDYINSWAKKNKSIIEKFREEPLELGKRAVKDFLEEMIKPSIKKMGIQIDNWFSEAEMVDAGEVKKAIAFFEKKDLIKEEESAIWFKTTKYGDDKDRVLIKSDGEQTYFANDAAYHWDKFVRRDFDRVINIWGADHHGYVNRLKAAVAAIGFPGQLEVVIMQLVRLIKNGQEYKMSKRAGTYVTIDELFNLIGTNDANDVARYFFVSRDFSTHMDFDLNLAEDTSEKNPVYYVKYAYARINGIIEKASKFKLQSSKFEEKDFKLLKKKEELDLIRILIQLPELIQDVATSNDYPIHKFAYYLYEVAEKFHRFYQADRVIIEDKELSKSRLALVEATKTILEITGRDVLGLTLPKRM